MPSNIYETITDRIIAQLESGIIPWRKEWKSSGSTGLPRNIVSGKNYRGINLLTLMMSDFADSRWMTYKQAQAQGANVRKGEHGTPIVFWKFQTIKDAKGDDRDIAWARSYTVFNAEQIDGLQPVLPLASTFRPIDTAQQLADAYMQSPSHPTLTHTGDRAFYRPLTDAVVMPQRHAFTSAQGYYATLFHEFAHSTGHSSRLNRELGMVSAFGSADYSDEELCAEFAAAFLTAEAGIANDQTLTNSTAYIQGWLHRLRNDKAIAVRAAQRAQKAADFILQRSATVAAALEMEQAA